MAERRIVAFGGFTFGDEVHRGLEKELLRLTGRERPRVCFLPTASADDADYTVIFYEAFSGRADPTHVVFHPWPPDDLRARIVGADLVYVGGGNTANMLAIWRVHGVDGMLREAWEAGAILCGSSAGMICWFEAGVTDSFGPQLRGMRDGLGFLPGSACPHYDAEELRRPRYHGLVREGFPAGYAAEDGVGLVFHGTQFAEAVSGARGKRGYHVELRDGEIVETPIEARVV
jgi:dipeptidase E